MKSLLTNREMNLTRARRGAGIPRVGVEVGMLSLAAMLAMLPMGARAGDVNWIGSTPLWVTPTNWDTSSVPTAADNVYLPASSGFIMLPSSGAVGNGMNVDGEWGFTLANLTLSDRLWVAPTLGGSLTLAGSALTAPSVTVGVADTSTNGKIEVYSGDTLSVAGNLGIGYGGTGHSLLTDGTVTAGSVTVGGNTAGAKGNSFTVGSTGTLTSAGTLIVGYNDNTNNGWVYGALNTGATQLGTFADSNLNYISVEPGGTWTATDSVVVGLGGSANNVYNEGTITMSGAGKDFVVGHDATAAGNYTVVNSGGSLSINGGLYAGKGGDQNTVWIGDFNTPGSIGTVTSTVGRIGSDAGSDGNTVVVANSGSSWTLSNSLRVGGSGSGNDLEILNGGVVSVTGNKNVWVGYADNSGGNRIIVDGVGSTLDVQGTGEITLSNGGLPTNSDYNIIEVVDGGHVNAAKVNLGPTSAILLGQSNGASPFGTIDPATELVGFGNPNGTLFDPTSGASVVAVSTFAGAGTYTLPNVISGTATFLLEGGTVELTGANTYTGPTLVFGGTLQLSGASNNIASSSEIVTVPGATFDVSGVTGGFSLGSTQALKGLGTVVGNVTAPSGSTIQGGTEYFGGPGELTFTDNLTMQGGSNLNVSIFAENPVETDQTNAGSLWSMVQVTGTLSLTGLDVTPVAINLENGAVIPNGTNTWAILAADGGIDFNGTPVTPYTDYTSFFDVWVELNNDMAGWSGALENIKVISLGDSNTLYLQATSVPEPGQTMAVLVVGGFLGGRVLRRRRTV